MYLVQTNPLGFLDAFWLWNDSRAFSDFVSESPSKISLDIPGFEKEEIKLNVYGNRLEISAKNDTRNYRKIIKFNYNININEVDARYKNGVLTVDVGNEDKNKTEIKVK